MIYPKIINNFPYIINKKTSDSIIAWIMLLIIFFLIFLLFAFNYQYRSYDTYFGYVKNNDLVLYVEENKISSLYSFELLIENERLNFKIKQISEQFYVLNNENYYEVTLQVELKKEWLIENNILNITFQKPKTTIYKQIKKGMLKWKN